VVPGILPKLLMDPDKEKAKRAMAAMMEMKKLDIAKLQAAFDGTAG
jgi:predicted 3-demethylubiquinone-9 3-methyltransferase (glyoxalase superfamily)